MKKHFIEVNICNLIKNIIKYKKIKVVSLVLELDKDCNQLVLFSLPNNLGK